MANAEKRSVSTDALETLGTIIDETAGRDAIHLAVEPVIAAQQLWPGQDVGKVPGGYGAGSSDLLGIVDPFLKGPVRAGQRFWLVVYPRQITSLRHVWAHPKFDEPAPPVPTVDPKKVLSESWLRNFVSGLDTSLSYDQIIERAAEDDGYMSFGDGIYGHIPDEFWDHVEVVTGKKITNRADYFSCAC